MWRARCLYPLHCRNIWDIWPTLATQKKDLFFSAGSVVWNYLCMYIYMYIHVYSTIVYPYAPSIEYVPTCIINLSHSKIGASGDTLCQLGDSYWLVVEPSSHLKKMRTVKMGENLPQILGVNIKKIFGNHENWVILRFPPPIIQTNEIQETWPTTAAMGWRVMWIFQCGPRSGQQFKRFCCVCEAIYDCNGSQCVLKREWYLERLYSNFIACIYIQIQSNNNTFIFYIMFHLLGPDCTLPLIRVQWKMTQKERTTSSWRQSLFQWSMILGTWVCIEIDDANNGANGANQTFFGCQMLWHAVLFATCNLQPNSTHGTVVLLARSQGGIETWRLDDQNRQPWKCGELRIGHYILTWTTPSQCPKCMQ